eukprot:5725411-Prymnesium_polylepis.1
MVAAPPLPATLLPPTPAKTPCPLQHAYMHVRIHNTCTYALSRLEARLGVARAALDDILPPVARERVAKHVVPTHAHHRVRVVIRGIAHVDGRRQPQRRILGDGVGDGMWRVGQASRERSSVCCTHRVAVLGT